jgi:hypothetical protein
MSFSHVVDKRFGENLADAMDNIVNDEDNNAKLVEKFISDAQENGKTLTPEQVRKSPEFNKKLDFLHKLQDELFNETLQRDIKNEIQEMRQKDGFGGKPVRICNLKKHLKHKKDHRKTHKKHHPHHDLGGAPEDAFKRIIKSLIGTKRRGERSGHPGQEMKTIKILAIPTHGSIHGSTRRTNRAGRPKHHGTRRPHKIFLKNNSKTKKRKPKKHQKKKRRS